VNEIVGTAIPNEFIGAIEKGFYEAVEKVKSVVTLRDL
jgi:hypothetical protein